MNDLERSSDLFNLLKADKSASDTAMEADDSLFDNSGKREPVEELIDLIEDRVMLRRVLTESVAALFSEAECIIDPLVLVVSSQEMNLFWESDLQRHEQADSLK